VRIARHGSQRPVYGITTAEQSHTEDITRRQKQYILTMLVRVVSIVVVVAVPVLSWPIKIVLVAVAALIPYFAVVRANGGPPPEKDPTNLLLAAPQRPALHWEQHGLPGSGPVVDGESGGESDAHGTAEPGDADRAGEAGVSAETGEFRAWVRPAQRESGGSGPGDATGERIYSEP
jgi:hypothetical protein